MGEQTILIVEDDATIARFVELELEHAGFDVLRFRELRPLGIFSYFVLAARKVDRGSDPIN